MPERMHHQGLRVIVAGGGTGGHLFPGIAVAQALMARDKANTVLFVNAGKPLEKQILEHLGWPQQAIRIEGLKGRGLWRQMRGAFKIPSAVWQSAMIVKYFRPDVVFGVGGYSAGPVVTAAWLAGRPTAIHEQNRLPGVTNRMLGRIAKRIYVSFEASAEYFNPAKVVVSGNPVRDEILALGLQQQTAAPSGDFTVLVVGGSQGAQAINRAMADALGYLKGHGQLCFVHQTGADDQDWVKQAYIQAGMIAEVKAFFNDMAARYQRADLIICRAGATTVAEITVIGKTAVFVPFPFAADDHQTKNAQALADAGAADMIAQDDLDGRRLAETIKTYFKDRRKLADMANKARALGHPEAAQTIVDDLYALSY